LNRSSLQKPGIHRYLTDKYDELRTRFLDQIELKQNIFLEYTDPKLKNSDRTIIPIEFQFDFYGLFKQGIGSIHGPTQEFAGAWKWYQFQLSEC
jgi:hypothetical protein